MFTRQILHAFRRLMRSPMFAALTLLTLAIGIGTNTAIFSVLNGVLLKPLPYPDSDRLVALWLTGPGVGIKQLNPSPAVYFTFREESTAFQSVGVWSRGSASVTGIAEPEDVPALLVTETILPTLGVPPARGRWFTAKDDEPKAPETAILTYQYWQLRFGGDNNILGRKLTINGRTKEIIGVMPEHFIFPNYRPSLIMPLQFNRAETHLGNFSYQGIARLKPGTTLSAATADVSRMLPMMFGKFPPPRGMSAKAFEEARIAPDLRMLKDDVVGDVGRVLWVLMATVGIVLFIVCANVANLLLVRADGRQQELAVRAALGASWTQIARELLVESVMLGLMGGVLGLGVAYGALKLLIYLSPSGLPRLNEIALDPVVLFFAFALSLAGGFIFGLIPVAKYATPGIAAAVRAGGRTSTSGRERHRTRSTLVVVQVALALVLLIGSGLMLRTFQMLRQVQPGFTKPEEVLTLRISIPTGQVADPERAARMHHDIAHKLAGIGGVQSVALTNSMPMDGANSNDPIFAEDRTYSESQIPPIRRFKHVGPGYARTLGNRIVSGRDFVWTDVLEKRPVTIVSENLAREMWGSAQAAVGKRIRENPKAIWREIVGVIADERDDGVQKRAPAIVFWPYFKEDFYANRIELRRSLVYAIRSNRAGSSGFLREVQNAIWSINPNLPLANVRTLQEIYDRSMARTSFTLVMLGLASGMALLIGLVGIYGVISYSISQRTREIGIRMALGAQHSNVRALFVRHGLILASLGVACGIAAAIPLARLLSALLFEVSPLDPLTYAAVAAVLIAAALIATYLPARRATLIEPVIALRTE